VTSARCPSEDALSRALDLETDAALAGHVARCPACRATQDGLRRAIALAKGLPTNVPGASRREEVRAGMLALAEAGPTGTASRTPWHVGVIALGAAAAMLVLWLAKGRDDNGRDAAGPAPSHVVVRPAPGARYVITSPPPWETIRLSEGAIDLDVQPLGPRDRVRVEVGDGEVEVRGTRFQVTARADRLVGVDVTHGRVEVRPRGATPTVLGAGQRWRATPDEALEVAPSPPIAEAPAPSPPREVRSRPRRLAARTEAAVERALQPTRQEILYDDAWDALRARKFKDAATGFGRVLAASSSGPLADEAAFWRATALARDGDSTGAIVAFRAYLATYRDSPRRGEASAILGWLLVDTYQNDEASAFFRAAAADPHETVRQSALEGLAAIARASQRH
jgi:hypothetical protein